ncbi:helix-turn-helix transcriptional regulator [Mammaliicoccus vitulinus]|uniref:helix-turn-helix domain-containing protein n=1 Tax=Mammaliicoccus vitulinus TaxID=71237 RepID=UPI002DBEAB42|nr:helix-turn-helix transcriptional regulator [Mammaliicoccus vitulinus]MEB7657615.1 helix-turn-helix transcriptional regulator [Mammaliicoccus vitulinus]
MIKFRLKEIMKSKGLKISDLNEATGISRNSLSLLINGKSQGIQFENLEKIASELSVEIGDLFERVFNDLEIELGEKEEVYLKKQNINSKYANSSRHFFALKCNLFEDNMKRTGYIPYKYSIEFTPKPQITFQIDLKYSEFHSYLKKLFDEYSTLQLIFLNYFAQKVIELEKEKLEKIKDNFNIPMDEITFLISGGNIDLSITDVKFNDFKFSNNEQTDYFINDLNESNVYNFKFGNTIKISLK